MSVLDTNVSSIHEVNGDDINLSETIFEVNLNVDNSPKKEDENKEELVTSNSVALTSTLLQNLSLNDGKCGFSLSHLYKFALKFYKDMSGKAVHLSYEDNCHLVALSQQVSQGPLNPATASTLGVLDVVGRDRRLAWQALGSLSKDEAKNQFIETLHKLAPTFQPYIEALWADHLEKERIKKEGDLKRIQEEEERKKEEENKRKDDEEKRRQEETKRQIQEALNQQTFAQFKVYSEQQYPGNPEQQAVLIKQLQEQHYQQYMQQVYQQQLLQTQQTDQSQQQKVQIPDGAADQEDQDGSRENSFVENGDLQTEDEQQTDEEGNEPNIAPASMWTRRDIKEFKQSIKQEGGDSVIKVGHGETVTVRVPTHDDGTCLFWEFATDSYDIGFGIYFEWINEPSNAVSVHITESDDEEEEEDGEDDNDDIERLAGVSGLGKLIESNKPPTSVIIPVYRRDCHEEVYAGSHTYPGTGVYLLKFDNSYSLWRSKVLYYRVYYTR